MIQNKVEVRAIIIEFKVACHISGPIDDILPIPLRSIMINGIVKKRPIIAIINQSMIKEGVVSSCDLPTLSSPPERFAGLPKI